MQYSTEQQHASSYAQNTTKFKTNHPLIFTNKLIHNQTKPPGRPSCRHRWPPVLATGAFINSCSQAQQRTNSNSNDLDANEREGRSIASSHGQGRSSDSFSRLSEPGEKDETYNPERYPMIERKNKARGSKNRTPLDMRNHLRIKGKRIDYFFDWWMPHA